MKKFEYKIVTQIDEGLVDLNKETATLFVLEKDKKSTYDASKGVSHPFNWSIERYLNHLGSLGWEVVTHINLSNKYGVLYRYTLKREVGV